MPRDLTFDDSGIGKWTEPSFFEVTAERIAEYADLGIDTVILSGYPHLEEAYRVGEDLLPRLGVERPQQQAVATPFVGISVASRESGTARPEAIHLDADRTATATAAR